MIARIILLGKFSAIMLLISIFEQVLDKSFPLLCGASVCWRFLKLFGHLRNLNSNQAYSLFDRFLAVPCHTDQIASWHEHQHYVNSILRKHLILFIKSVEKVVISNLDDVSTFEMLSSHLHTQLPNRKE